MSEQAEQGHDLFVSYAGADRAWVEGYLLDALQAAGVRVHSEEAFRLGVPRLLEFERAVKEGQRVLLVLTPAYLGEGFTQFTDLMAQSYGLETATWPVIPLLLQPVALPTRLSMLQSLDATEPSGWDDAVQRLCAELQRPVPGPAPKPPCPYPGMVPFSEADSDRFFGRDHEVAELVQQLRLHPFLTVIGPSGSGKSSLVFAGLVPALQESGLFGPGGWVVHSIRPGEASQGEMVEARGGVAGEPASVVSSLLAGKPEARRSLVVVDQFEELFTGGRPDVEAFQEAVLHLAEMPECFVVLTVRADFYPDLMACRLWPKIQAHRAEVLPLDEAGLRQAIVRPAEDAGVFVETALVERLVADAVGEPGILPFVQETLVLLWERVERRYLPLRAYEALILSARKYRELGAGRLTGLQVAMADRAEAALQALGPGEQAIARRIFVRLVNFGEGRADTRRQQPAVALRAAGDDPDAFERTLRHLADYRLLTLGGEEERAERTVDIAHEALIDGWPTLRRWLAERREAEQTRRRLEAKAIEWERLGRGSGGLLDRVELLEADRWLAGSDAAELGSSVVLPALVEASRLAEAQEATQRRRAARFRLAAVGLIATLIVVALGIQWWNADRLARQERAAADAQATLAGEADARRVEAVYARETAEDLARAEASARADAEARGVEAVQARETAEAERDRADQQARLALGRQLAAQANELVGEDDGSLSLLLAMAAISTTYRHDGTVLYEAEAALRNAINSALWHATLMGHEGRINNVSFDPDGTTLATAGLDGTIIIWDVRSGEIQRKLLPNLPIRPSILHVAFSPDGQRIVTAEGEGAGITEIWDVPSGQVVLTLAGHQGTVNSAEFSADGKRVVTASEDGTARVWEAESGEPITVYTGHGGARLTSAAFSPNGQWVVSGGYDGQAHVWDAQTGLMRLVLPAHNMEVRHVSFSTDGRFIATAGCDHRIIEVDCTSGSARVWDAGTGLLRLTLAGHAAGVNSAEFSPDGETLVTAGSDGKALLWNAEDGQLRASLTGHSDQVRHAAFDPSGTWIATASWDGTAKVWQTESEQVVATLAADARWTLEMAMNPTGANFATGGFDGGAKVWTTGSWELAHTLAHPGIPYDIAYSPDGGRIVTAGEDGTARIWDVQTGSLLAVLPAGSGLVFSAQFSPDGQLIVTAGDDGVARLWQTRTGEMLFSLTGHTAALRSARFDPEGESIVTTGEDGTVRLWEASSGRLHQVLIGHEGWVWDAIFMPDGRYVISGGQDDTARVWEVATGALLHSLGGHSGEVRTIVPSPDGQWIATADGFPCTSRCQTLIWKAESGELLRTLRGHTDSINSVSLSQDGQWLLTTSNDGTARVWDIESGGLRALLPHSDFVTNAAFSPDGLWVVTTSSDGKARVWPFDPQVLMAIARRHIQRDPAELTCDERAAYLHQASPCSTSTPGP